MSHADSDWYSNVVNFPPLRPLVKNCFYMKPDRTVESSTLGNGRSFAKIKMNLSKARDENKPSSRVSTRGSLKEQADDLMFEFGSDLAKLKENFNVLSKSVFKLLENCAKTESHTTSIVQEISELRQKMISMDEHMTEINDCATKIEHGRNNPASQESSLATSHAELVWTASSSTSVIGSLATSPSAYWGFSLSTPGDRAGWSRFAGGSASSCQSLQEASPSVATTTRINTERSCPSRNQSP